MPDRAQHLERAAGNEDLARSLNLDEGLEVDWAVTMIFYSALHYIDSFLAGKNLHPRDHDIRDAEIERNGSLNPIYKDYRRLKDASRAARYDIANYHKTDLIKFDSKFQNVKQHITALAR